MMNLLGLKKHPEETLLTISSASRTKERRLMRQLQNITYLVHFPVMMDDELTFFSNR